MRIVKIIRNIKKILLDCMPYFVYKAVEKSKNKNKIKIPKISTLQNFGIHVEQNEECIILGNGPSLRESLTGKTLEFIKKRKKFCVNDIPLVDEFKQLKPDYLVFMDPFYWCKDNAELIKSRYEKIQHILISDVDWKLKIFMPLPAREWNYFIGVPKQNKNVEIIYINTYTSSKEIDESRFIEYKCNSSIPRVQNVLVACLYIAINAGYKKSYIFGADHSWHELLYVREDNVLCQKYISIYNKEEAETYIPFFKNADKSATFTIAELFEAFSYAYKSYEELEKYSQYMGTKIYNASGKSYIDAFERIKIEKGV